jgi:hypothetical protein
MTGHPEWHDEALALAARGLTNAEIGRQLGRTASAVSKALHPERAKAYNRESNAKRHEVKLAWARTPKGREGRRRIEDRHRKDCADCGSPLYPSSEWRATERCRACHNAKRRASRQAA